MGFTCVILLTIMTRDGGDFEATRIPVERSEIVKVEEVNKRDGAARSKVFFKRAPKDGVLVFETPDAVKSAPCRTIMDK